MPINPNEVQWDEQSPSINPSEVVWDKPSKPKYQNTMKDRASQFGTGAFRGGVTGMLGLAGDTMANVEDIGRAAYGYLGHEYFGLPIDKMPEMVDRKNYTLAGIPINTSERLNQKLRDKKLGFLVDPSGEMDETGRYLSAAGARIGGGIAGGGLVGLGRGVANIAKNATIGGLSALASQAVSESNPFPDTPALNRAAVIAASYAPPALIGGAKYTGRVANSVIQPFTPSGQHAIAQKTFQRFGEGSPDTVDLTQFIPGSKPTLAEATGNSGIAGVQRVMSDANSNPFQNRLEENNLARENALNTIAGNPLDIQNAMAAREVARSQNQAAAFSQRTPTNPTPVIQAIDSILASKSGKRDAVVNALKSVRSKLFDSNGNLETDPEMLYGARQHLTDILDKSAPNEFSNAKLATEHLMDVKNVLDSAIEQGAPGYKNYLKDFADKSKPINSMQLLQGLNLTDANGNMTLSKVDSAIKSIEKQQNSRGANDAKSLSNSQLITLRNLREDLRRQGTLGKGKAIGSNSFQNLSTDNILAEALPGKLGSLINKVGGNTILGQIGGLAYSGPNKAIRSRMTDIALDPSLYNPPAPPAPGRTLRDLFIPAYVNPQIQSLQMQISNDKDKKK